MRIFLTSEIACQHMYEELAKMDTSEGEDLKQICKMNAKCIAEDNNLLLHGLYNKNMALISILMEKLEIPLTAAHICQFAWTSDAKDILKYLLETNKGLHTLTSDDQENMLCVMSLTIESFGSMKMVIEDYNFPIFESTLESAVCYNNPEALRYILNRTQTFTLTDRCLKHISRKDLSGIVALILPYIQNQLEKTLEECVGHDAYKCVKLLLPFFPKPLPGRFLCIQLDGMSTLTSMLTTLLLLEHKADASWNNYYAIRNHTNYFAVEVMIESLSHSPEKLSQAELCIRSYNRNNYLRRKTERAQATKKIYFWWIPICYAPERGRWRVLAEKSYNDLFEPNSDSMM